MAQGKSCDMAEEFAGLDFHFYAVKQYSALLMEKNLLVGLMYQSVKRMRENL
ncbi:MAG: hypothetical protein LBK66_01985 [Spirochaetaceae bacterium]|jgi:hypothetical protein|nr:hypothetical protein [Spirochaetaceae bacterium]